MTEASRWTKPSSMSGFIRAVKPAAVADIMIMPTTARRNIDLYGQA